MSSKVNASASMSFLASVAASASMSSKVNGPAHLAAHLCPLHLIYAMPPHLATFMHHLRRHMAPYAHTQGGSCIK